MKLLLRLILSPFIAVWGVLLVSAILLFPGFLLVFYSFFGFISYPVIWVLNKSGNSILGIEPFCDITSYPMINHFIAMTSPVWGVPAIVIYYVITGKVWSAE